MSVSLFEISWEVCNKVGGIHTVLGSKLKYAKEFASNYIVFGPYKNTEEFEEQELPQEFNSIQYEVNKLGITLHYGLWKTHDEEVKCILVELTGFEEQKDIIKGKIWEHFQIDSLGTSWFDYDEVLTWSWACGIVCEKLAQLYHQEDIVVHAHEWISAGAIFEIESSKLSEENIHNEQIKNIKTVFTTHATMLGRAYFGTFGKLLTKEDMGDKSGLDIAKELGVHTKYQTEYQALRVANKSTCVSKLLQNEIEELYDYQNCNVTENGFEIELSFDDCIRQFSEKHSILTNKVQEYFNPYYTLKKNMRIGIISGRFEIGAKGYDTTFKALGELNNELKKKDSTKNIVILAPIIAGEFETQEDENVMGCSFAPISKYNIELNHPLMELCTHNGLMNRKEDKVKVILIPNLISKDHKVFDLEYYDMLQACDFSLYPSGYEPWGYTPHESIAYGVVTLTSENAGFGKYWIDSHINNSTVKSVLGQEFNEKVNQIKSFVFEEYQKLASTQYREKKYALEYSKELQWKSLFENYKNIYEGE